MSTPDEKERALNATREWLFRLLDRRYQPTITEIRQTACRLLRHYPWTMDADAMRKALDHEDLHPVNKSLRQAQHGRACVCGNEGRAYMCACKAKPNARRRRGNYTR